MEFAKTPTHIKKKRLPHAGCRKIGITKKVKINNATTNFPYRGIRSKKSLSLFLKPMPTRGGIPAATAMLTKHMTDEVGIRKKKTVALRIVIHSTSIKLFRIIRDI